MLNFLKTISTAISKIAKNIIKWVLTCDLVVIMLHCKNMSQFFNTKYVSFQPDKICVNLSVLWILHKKISDFEILKKLCFKNSIWNFKCIKKQSNIWKRNWYSKIYLILLKFHSDKRLIAVYWLRCKSTQISIMSPIFDFLI